MAETPTNTITQAPLLRSPFFPIKTAPTIVVPSTKKEVQFQVKINKTIDGNLCQVILVPNFFTRQESAVFFDHLKNLPYHSEPAMFGGECLRKTLSYGQFDTPGRENDPVKYNYSKKIETAINPWDPEINKIRLRIIEFFEDVIIPFNQEKSIDATKKSLKRKRCDDQLIHRSNYCLIQNYPNKKSGIGWHADSESDLVENSPIYSMSFGATRNFQLCRKEEVNSKEKPSLVDVVLPPGTLLIMAGATQKYYKHRVPPGRVDQDGQRINLTFRSIYEDQSKN